MDARPYVCPDDDGEDQPTRRKSRFGRGFNARSIGTVEGCLEALDEIAVEIIDIEEQLEEVEAFPDDYQDKDAKLWLISARAAHKHRKMKQFQLSKHLRALEMKEADERFKALGSAKPDTRQANQINSMKPVVAKYHALIAVCKERLTAEVYSEIAKEAKKRMPMELAAAEPEPPTEAA